MHRRQLLWIMRIECIYKAQLRWAQNWHLVSMPHFGSRQPVTPPQPATPHSCNWPDHHRGRWVGSCPGLLWEVWTGKASHQNTSKGNSAPRALAGHMRRSQRGPCPRHSWREQTAECLGGQGSQSLNGKEWFLWSKTQQDPVFTMSDYSSPWLTRTPYNHTPLSRPAITLQWPGTGLSEQKGFLCYLTNLRDCFINILKYFHLEFVRHYTSLK